MVSRHARTSHAHDQHGWDPAPYLPSPPYLAASPYRSAAAIPPPLPGRVRTGLLQPCPPHTHLAGSPYRSAAAMPYMSVNSAWVRGMWKELVTAASLRQPAGIAAGGEGVGAGGRAQGLREAGIGLGSAGPGFDKRG